MIRNIFFLLILSTQLQSQDWFFAENHAEPKIYTDNEDLYLDNGLVRRTFRITDQPNCISYKNLVTGQELVRSVAPEAAIKIDGIDYEIAPINLPKQVAYLNDSLLAFITSAESPIDYIDYSMREAVMPFAFTPKNWSTSNQLPEGKQIRFHYELKEKQLKIDIVYQLFKGVPVIEKWVEVTNHGQSSVRVNQIKNEILRMVEEESAVAGSTEKMLKPSMIYFETNYSFDNAMNYRLSDKATHWKADSSYTSQVNYRLLTPAYLEIYPEKGIGIDLASGDSIKSLRTYEVLFDSYDRERRGMIKRKFYKVMLPWTNQNPIFMHLISTKDEDVKTIIDQCVETGYEMVILSFGSGLNMEDTSAANIRKFKALADYAHSKGIKLGGYSLFSSRTIGPETDVIDPISGEPNKGATFGHAPCLASAWGLQYLHNIKYFLENTGFDLLEHDGPYPGDLCASTSHPGHRDVEDSQWQQFALQKELYHWCQAKGIYVNAPDWYFMDGSNKIGLGYREVNFSLPRDEQKILNRQNIYDGTWEKNSSMSWGFVPLTKYQGGGPEAVLEPLSEHLGDYEELMQEYYGAGVQACYRGPRLYDTGVTKMAVTQMINWYKMNRTLLNGYLIHLQRANGRDWDGWMMVDKGEGLILLFNPLDKPISFDLEVNTSTLGGGKEFMVTNESETLQRISEANKISIPVTLQPSASHIIRITAK